MSNHKQKAKELVDKYINVEYLIDFDGMNIELAKQCALIAVDEILEAIKGMVDEESGYSANGYYLEVKREIELL